MNHLQEKKIPATNTLIQKRLDSKRKERKKTLKKKKKKSLKKKKDEELNDALYPFSQNYKLADYKFGQWPPIIRSRAMLQKDLA
jgi:hypothetical protein